MDELYGLDGFSDEAERHTKPSATSSSSSSSDRRRRRRRQHLQRRTSRHEPHQPRHHTDAYRYNSQRGGGARAGGTHALQSLRVPHRRATRTPESPHDSTSTSQRARSSASSSSTEVSSSPVEERPEEADDEGGFLSAVSARPSLEFIDDDDNVTPARTVSAENDAALVEDFPVPPWSQGSRLLERRIQQAVDRETTELNAETPSVLSRGVSGNPSLAAGSLMNYRPPPGPPPLAPTAPSTEASASTSFSPPLRPRMQEAQLLADPRNRLLDLVITNTSASVTLGEVEEVMQWSALYEPMYGPLLEYLQSYQSIFVVSPVDDRVRLRRVFSIRTSEAQQDSSPGRSSSRLSVSGARQRHGRRTPKESTPSWQRSSSPAATERRPGKPALPSAEALAAHIGSVSYSCVAERLHVGVLETVYRRRGYDTAMMHGVLHVTNESVFHLFCFSSGAVVWWGMDRKDHWMVEDDFLSAANHIADGVEHRYVQSEIDALFPIWCSYEVDEQCEHTQIASPLGVQPTAVEPALERLSKVLCFDHYLVPRNEPARSLVMLTFSHSLGCSARVDYFEFVTKWSHRHILSIPAEFSGLLDYFSTKRRIAKLEGEIEVAQLAIQSIHDTPEVLWEVPWLQAYYDLAEQQNTTQSRLSWFASRSDTLLEQLSHIKARRYRLFMLGSDVFLIVILVLDVMFMTSRLVAKMYFKVEEED